MRKISINTIYKNIFECLIFRITRKIAALRPSAATVEPFGPNIKFFWREKFLAKKILATFFFWQLAV